MLKHEDLINTSEYWNEIIENIILTNCDDIPNAKILTNVQLEIIINSITERILQTKNK